MCIKIRTIVNNNILCTNYDKIYLEGRLQYAKRAKLNYFRKKNQFKVDFIHSKI